jgi:hypothetical protein
MADLSMDSHLLDDLVETITQQLGEAEVMDVVDETFGEMYHGTEIDVTSEFMGRIQYLMLGAALLRVAQEQFLKSLSGIVTMTPSSFSVEN